MYDNGMRIDYNIIKQAVRVLNETTILSDAPAVEFAYGNSERFVYVRDVMRYYKRKLTQIKWRRNLYSRQKLTPTKRRRN